jgi:ATP-dependent Clp protease ATP-binding subunit ClpA
LISQELEVSLHMAFVEARRLHHEFLTVEHLLLALLDNPSASKVLSACSVNIDDLRKTLTSFIKDNTPQVSGTKEVDGRRCVASYFQREKLPRGVLPASTWHYVFGCCESQYQQYQKYEGSTAIHCSCA